MLRNKKINAARIAAALCVILLLIADHFFSVQINATTASSITVVLTFLAHALVPERALDSPVAQPSTEAGENIMTGADIWNALTGPQSAGLWQIFAALANATGHTTAASRLIQLGQLAPVVAQAVPPHPATATAAATQPVAVAQSTEAKPTA